MEVTREQLAKALDGQWVYAKNRDGTHHAQVADYDNVARELLEKLAEQQAQESDPWAEVPAPAHICCEHVLGSLASDELDVMDKIASLLRHRSERSRRRVLAWARDFLLDRDEPPF